MGSSKTWFLNVYTSTVSVLTHSVSFFPSPFAHPPLSPLLPVEVDPLTLSLFYFLFSLSSITGFSQQTNDKMKKKRNRLYMCFIGMVCIIAFCLFDMQM